MASAQERTNIHRGTLDKWTKREQLCLASAVSCSGDQNWMTVSRSLKLLCGVHHPPDWFSQKHCAVKYGELLENVETPKRKKRTTSDNASNVVETPTDLILRRLTEERIQELKYEIREQQETYAKLYTDVVHLQTGNSNEEQIRAMWMEIEREQEQDRQLRARKQMTGHDVPPNWRQAQCSHQKSQVSITPVKQEQDMEIDETCKPQGTSPLLSSLLQSTAPSTPVGNTTTTSTARVTAPTITNLLTGGVINSSGSSSSVSSSAPVQISGLLSQTIPLTKPLTGPAPSDSVAQATNPTVLSPSQSAPTLSMLLEKSKTSKDSPQHQSGTSQPAVDEVKVEPVQEAATEEAAAAIKNEDESTMDQETTEDEQQLMEVFKNLMPENIEEFADMLTNNNGILNPGILEEESILEGVESLMDEAQEVDDQLETKLSENENTQDSKNPPPIEDDSEAKQKTEISIDTKLTASKPPESPIVADKPSEKSKDDEPSKSPEEKPELQVEEKIETISSDDSSDNVPLATHAKEVKAASIAPPDDGAEDISKDSPNVLKQSPLTVDDGESQSEQTVVEKATDTVPSNPDDDEVILEDDEESNQKNDQTPSTTRKGSLSDSSDVIIIPTDDESNDTKIDSEKKQNQGDEESPSEAPAKDDEHKLEEDLPQCNTVPAASESSFSQEQTICLPDTDDDSSTFEAPTTYPKDDKLNPTKQQSQCKRQEPDTKIEDETKQTIAIRKLRDRDRSESPLVEDDTSDHSTTVRSRRRYSSTPVIDSIPNSPASSDDREFKVWKKPLMTIYNNLLTNKNAAIFLRPFSEEQSPRYNQVCLRPMDLQIIKRHIENGSIRNVTDFQRDIFLMCNNATMMFKKNSSFANMARELMNDFVQLKDQVLDAKSEREKSSASSSQFTPGVKVRGSARKSQRLP